MFIFFLILCLCDFATSVDHHSVYETNKCEGRRMLVSPSLSMGLHNQLNLLVHAIYIGARTSRNVCIRGFLPDFNSFNFIHLGWIYDIVHMNREMNDVLEEVITKARIELKTKEIDQKGALHITKFDVGDYAKAICLVLQGEGATGRRKCPQQAAERFIRALEPNYKGVLPFMLRDDIQRLDAVSLTAGLPFQDYGFNEEDKKFIQMIHESVVRFLPAYYDNVAMIMNEFRIHDGNFTAIHMRLEDDAMSEFWTWNNWKWEETPHIKKQGLKYNWTREEHDIFVTSEFLKVVTRKVPYGAHIFLCTALTKQKNRLNFLVDILRGRYMEDKIHIVDVLNRGNTHIEYQPPIEGREIAAIMDFIIATKATQFIGISASTFSINAVRHLNKKERLKSQHDNTEQLIREGHYGVKEFVLFDPAHMNQTIPDLVPRDLKVLQQMFDVPNFISGKKLIAKYRTNNGGHANPFDGIKYLQQPSLPNSDNNFSYNTSSNQLRRL